MIQKLLLVLVILIAGCSNSPKETYVGQDIKISGDVHWSGTRLWDHRRLANVPRVPIALIFKEGENIDIPTGLKTSNPEDWDDESYTPVIPAGRCEKSYFLYVWRPEEPLKRRIHATGTITFTRPISGVIEGAKNIRDTQPLFYPQAKTREQDYEGWWINLEGSRFKEPFARDYITIKDNTLTFDITNIGGIDGLRIIVGCTPK